ncbi:cupin-like domain-containing protein [Pseudoduganella sp. UC29_106]|uniref:cupin-like domain-containing protein n=1 Tax=Pseudoduganella sp. UC29_106 TaxID=3374553 RepID=UPI00375711DB
MTTLARTPEIFNADAAAFAAATAAQRPVVLRGLVRHWPSVREAMKSPEALCHYLMGFDGGGACDTVLMPPEVQGRLFYSADMKGFNFARSKRTVPAVIEQIARYSQFPVAPAVAMQSALLSECLPGFAAGNPAPFLPPDVQPRLWLGNEVVTPAHFDESHNLACVVSGNRRFTLFPPEQVGNLYIGPLDFAPTPTPISLVSFRAPDFGRFPRFHDALAAAQVAELEPGDALYIPTLWWHHVESIGLLNTMVNYWWSAPAANGLSKASVLAQVEQ